MHRSVRSVPSFPGKVPTGERWDRGCCIGGRARIQMKSLWIASAIITVLLAGLVLWFNENLKELLKQWGWNTVFARYWSKLRCNLSWQHLRGLWWLWLSGGIVLALCLTMLVFGLPTFGTPPLPNPLHDEAAKWRVTRNIYDMSLNRNAQGYKKCEIIFVRYPMPYAENYEHDLTEILRVAGWIIHPSSFASR